MRSRDCENVMPRSCRGQRTARSFSGVSRDIQAVQPFPEGALPDEKNQGLKRIRARVRGFHARAYSYVATSVKLDRGSFRFRQQGSAPNFQGGILTLCTCKHQMRASQSCEEWENDVWLLGFTSRTLHKGKHWLFYLAKIQFAFESHGDLWNSMKEECRAAKAAHEHFLGDMFEPKRPNLTGNARYSPDQYHAPSRHCHRKGRSDVRWHNDINYRLAWKYGSPALLVADPESTFLWEEPTIYIMDDHCRNYRKWSSLQEVMKRLRETN